MNILPDFAQKIYKEYAELLTGRTFQKIDEAISENCLYLNVVSPGIDDKKRPVMIYLHGGGFSSGAGSAVSDTCDTLLDEEDVVLVSINHRLNAFGFLYLREFDEKYKYSGILGLLDIILALKWVKENIQHFGGDLDNVTLIGESGGASKIAHLLAMPEAEGLFHKAILMSGATIVGEKTPEEGHQETLLLLEKLNISPENWEQLLDIPADDIIVALKHFPLFQQRLTAFAPTVDGGRLPFNFTNEFKTYEHSKRIPIVVGASEEELMSNLDIDPEMTFEELKEKLLKQEFKYLQPLPNLDESNVDQLISIFRNYYQDTKPAWQIFVQIVSMVHYLGRGSYEMASAYAKETEVGNIWFYMVAYDTPVPGKGGLASAWHTADLPLAFRSVLRQDQESLSQSIAHSYAAFARTGSPSLANQEWMPFTQENELTMIFDEVCEQKEMAYHTLFKEIHKLLN